MRRSDFWTRLDAVLGENYAGSWAQDFVIPSLGCTTSEAFQRGDDTLSVWRAVCSVVDVPATLK